MSGMTHQLRCLKQHGDKPAYALFAEMGTGKTWIAMMNAVDLWRRGHVDAVLVFAPNGVQTNWTRIELPKHMPKDVQWRAAAWSSGNTKEERQKVAELCYPSATGVLRFLAMNWEAIQTEKGFVCAETFCRSSHKLMIVCDESDNVKDPRAKRTKALMKLKKYATWRRVMTGTPIDGSPFSAFAQFNFLDAAILGTTSYTAFKAEYAEMLPAGSPLLNAIVKKGNLRFTPQITAKDASGRPKYRNLEQLKRLIDPYTFRVKKEECLDLPKKMYKTVLFSLTKEQDAIYEKCEEECRLMFEGIDTPFARLTIATKLTQITSGYYLHPNSPEPVRIEGRNPKLDLLVERVQTIVDAGAQVIIWARYTVEIEDIMRRLGEAKISAGSYYGATTRDARTEAIDAFERGTIPVFVGNQQAGGTGITLIAASYVIYFSNNFRLRDRLQSEDRAHRIGQTKTVTYINIAAENTIDEAVVRNLESKKNVADMIVDGKFPLYRKEMRDGQRQGV